MGLTWDNPKDVNLDRVKIYRNNVLIKETTGSSFDDLTVNPLTEYSYKITTISKDGVESPGISTHELL